MDLYKIAEEELEIVPQTEEKLLKEVDISRFPNERTMMILSFAYDDGWDTKNISEELERTEQHIKNILKKYSIGDYIRFLKIQILRKRIRGK